MFRIKAPFNFIWTFFLKRSGTGSFFNFRFKWWLNFWRVRDALSQDLAHICGTCGLPFIVIGWVNLKCSCDVNFIKWCTAVYAESIVCSHYILMISPRGSAAMRCGHQLNKMLLQKSDDIFKATHAGGVSTQVCDQVSYQVPATIDTHTHTDTNNHNSSCGRQFQFWRRLFGK